MTVVMKKLLNIILKTEGRGNYKKIQIIIIEVWLSEEEKEAKIEYQRNRSGNMKEKTSQKSIKQLKY